MDIRDIIHNNQTDLCIANSFQKYIWIDKELQNFLPFFIDNCDCFHGPFVICIWVFFLASSGYFLYHWIYHYKFDDSYSFSKQTCGTNVHGGMSTARQDRRFPRL